MLCDVLMKMLGEGGLHQTAVETSRTWLLSAQLRDSGGFLTSADGLPGTTEHCLPGTMVHCLPGTVVHCLPGTTVHFLPGTTEHCLPGTTVHSTCLAVLSASLQCSVVLCL